MGFLDNRIFDPTHTYGCVYLYANTYTQPHVHVGLKILLFLNINTFLQYRLWISFNVSSLLTDSLIDLAVKVIKPSSGDGNVIWHHVTADLLLVIRSLAMEVQPYVVHSKVSSHTDFSDKMLHTNRLPLIDS